MSGAQKESRRTRNGILCTLHSSICIPLARAASMSRRSRKNSFLSATALVLLLLQAGATQAATTVTKIATGYEHSLFLKSDGSLWGMGRNTEGELGNGTRNNTNSFSTALTNAVSSGSAQRFYILHSQ